MIKDSQLVSSIMQSAYQTQTTANIPTPLPQKEKAFINHIKNRKLNFNIASAMTQMVTAQFIGRTGSHWLP